VGVTYWSIVILLLGGCVGSFLNVVIYRWSRDLSVGRPLRSFCPSCGHRIAWYDNLPLVSYILLAGRCRHCKANISWQYPAVEAATALAFLVTYDTFFVIRERLGIGTAEPADTIMFLAHCVLWAGLIGLTVMDLESYLVDIRLTWIILAAGLVAHTLWTPVASVLPATWIRPDAFGAAMAFAGTLGLIIGMKVFLSGEPQNEEDQPREPEDASRASATVATAGEGEGEAASGDTGPLAPLPPRKRYWPIAASGVVAALLIGYVVWLSGMRPDTPLSREYGLHTRSPDPQFFDQAPAPDGDWVHLLVVSGVLFVGLTLMASHPHEEVDEDKK